jgi:hypothetical protein
MAARAALRTPDSTDEWHSGQITELRLGQVTAVVALATLGCAATRNIAVHEPNLIGLTSGANVVYVAYATSATGGAAGTVNQKVDPSPGLLVVPIFPPWA